MQRNLVEPWLEVKAGGKILSVTLPSVGDQRVKLLVRGQSVSVAGAGADRIIDKDRLVTTVQMASDTPRTLAWQETRDQGGFAQ